ncbi:MAG: NUDIX hydrolase [Bauldia sp.]
MPDQKPQLAVSVVVRKDGAILLVQRGRAPYRGHWSLPGGRVKFGERLREAARRELLEETGIDAMIGEEIGVFEIVDDPLAPATHYVIVTFAADFRSGEALARDDAAAAEWVPERDIRGRPVAEGTLAAIERSA